MDFDSVLNRIYDRRTFAKKPGFSRIYALLEALGNPHVGLNYVHVSGTSGKGSTCAFIAEVCKQSGLKTGLFVSPYVIHFCERIQINGYMIEQDEVINLANIVCDAADKLQEPPTFFEVITAMAFMYFSKNNCDMVVLETGIGGTLDTTNIISNPLVTIINSIGYDHMEVLGDTIEEIATHKSGIIKPGGVTITTHTQCVQAMKIIEATSKNKFNKLVITLEPETVLGDSTFTYKDNTYKLKMAGRHQINNALLCIEACHILNKFFPCINDDKIKLGLGITTLPARQEILCSNPLVILDGSHNLDKIKALLNRVDEFSFKKCIFIMGILKDKQVIDILKMIQPYCSMLICVDIESPRALPKDEFYLLAKTVGINVKCADTYEQALQMYNKKMPLIICGSLYLCSNIRDLAIDFAKNIKKY